MHVQVLNGLRGSFTVGLDNVQAWRASCVSNRAGKVHRCSSQVGGRGGSYVPNCGYVLARDQQRMPQSRRLGGEKSNHVIIAVNLASIGLAGDNFTERAIHAFVQSQDLMYAESTQVPMFASMFA